MGGVKENLTSFKKLSSKLALIQEIWRKRLGACFPKTLLPQHLQQQNLPLRQTVPVTLELLPQPQPQEGSVDEGGRPPSPEFDKKK